MEEFKRKHNRIKDFPYTGVFAYFITICTCKKQLYFNDAAIVNNIILTLKSEAERSDFDIYAYCFMPDHLHLLLIDREGSGLTGFIKTFKQKSGYYFKQGTGLILWQKSYYDHVIRKKENLNNIASYVFNNPVRKKLVDDFIKYPFLGSMVFDVDDFYKSFQQLRNIDLSMLLKKS